MFWHRVCVLMPWKWDENDCTFIEMWISANKRYNLSITSSRKMSLEIAIFFKIVISFSLRSKTLKTLWTSKTSNFEILLKSPTLTHISVDVNWKIFRNLQTHGCMAHRQTQTPKENILWSLTEAAICYWIKTEDQFNAGCSCAQFKTYSHSRTW